MAQTTDQLSFVDAEIEYSENGSSWTDISGFANELAVDGGDRMSGEVYTAEGDTPLIAPGKRQPLEITVTVTYTEGTGDPFEDAREAYETDGGGDAYIRWSPKGGDSTEFQFTSAKGIITAFGYPQGPVEPGDPLTVQFTVKVPSISKAVVA